MPQKIILAAEEFNEKLLEEVKKEDATAESLQKIFDAYDVKAPLNVLNKHIVDSNESSRTAITTVLANQDLINVVRTFQRYPQEIGGDALISTILNNKESLFNTLLDNHISPTATVYGAKSVVLYESPEAAAIFNDRDSMLPRLRKNKDDGTSVPTKRQKTKNNII